jgi:hypothetical protein
MAQIGHTSSALALEVYTRKMGPQPRHRSADGALLQGADGAQVGINGDQPADVFSVEKTKTDG